MDITSGSKVRHPELFVYTLQVTLEVPPSGYCTNFPPPLYVICITYPSWDMLDVTLSGAGTTIPQRRGRNRHFLKAIGNNKAENELEGLVGLDVFFLSTLSSSHMIRYWNGLLNPPLCELINVFRKWFLYIAQYSFLCTTENNKLQWIFSPLRRLSDFIGLPWRPLQIIACSYISGSLTSVDCWLMCNILEDGFLWIPFHDQWPPWRCGIQTGPF